MVLLERIYLQGAVMRSFTFLEAPSFNYFFQSRIVDQSSNGSLFNLVSYIPLQRKIDPVKLKEERISFEHKALLNIFDSPISKFIQVKQGTEIAICSDIHFPSGEIMHVPMLDGKGTFEESLVSVQQIANYLKSDLFVFNSSNSFHCFSDKLLSQKDWLVYSEFLLSLEKGVDKKWIGHRVSDGYMCLRLTNNCDKVQVPAFYKVLVSKF